MLALLALLPVYAFLRGRAGKFSALRFPSADIARAAGGVARSSAGRLLVFLRILTVALCILALAGPRFANDRTETQASGVDIMLVFDLSWSMMALDMSGPQERVSRFDSASQVLEDFIRKRLSDRLGLIVFTQTCYRLTIAGQKNVPATGGALLVPNHVTFVDGFLITASLDRPVRFLVDKSYYEKWWMRPLMLAIGAIPISSDGGPRAILKALRDAGTYLDMGELVCIFAEGQLSRTGTLMPFRRGMERIVKGRVTPIIP